MENNVNVSLPVAFPGGNIQQESAIKKRRVQKGGRSEGKVQLYKESDIAYKARKNDD